MTLSIEEHQRKMQKLQATHKRKQERSQREKGLIIINTGLGRFPLMNCTIPTFMPCPSARKAIPSAAVVFPLPSSCLSGCSIRAPPLFPVCLSR